MAAAVFDPDEIQRIVRACIAEHGGGPLEPLLGAVTAALAERYPRQINEKWEWIFSIVAGYNCQIAMLHVSLGEYLLLEHSPIPVTGFTGRYWPTVHEFVIAGEEHMYREGDMDPRVYRPGDGVVFQPGEGACVSVRDYVCTIGYARGAIPSMFSLPLVDTLFGTLDYRSLWRTMALSTRLMWRSLTGRPQSG
jgi:C-8 sterol isomerase